MADGGPYRATINRDRLISIVDADASTCEALSVLFRLEGFETTFSLDLAGLYGALARRRPDVLVLNLTVGREDGVAALHQVRAMGGAMPVFMLADTGDVEHVVGAMKAGAADVLPKPINTERLLRGVFDVLVPEPHSGAEPAHRVIEVHGFAQLTPREQQVLQLITNGQSNKEAGRQLGISPRTIEVHRARVMEKLGARNTADLMRIVLTS